MKVTNYVDGMKALAEFLSMKRIMADPMILPSGMADLWIHERDIDLMRVAMRASCASRLLTLVKDMQGSEQDYQLQKKMLVDEVYLGEVYAHRILVGLWAIVGKDIEHRSICEGNYHTLQNQVTHETKCGIYTYEQYIQTFKEYCLNLGKSYLSKSEIQRFIDQYNLSQWNITVKDVQEDMKQLLLEKKRKRDMQSCSHEEPMPCKPKLTDKRKNINTYEQYLQALKDYCEGCGRTYLNVEEIGQFIKENRLGWWGITAEDIRVDITELFHDGMQPRNVFQRESINPHEGYEENGIHT